MTTDDAQAILRDLTEMEFLKVMGLSIIFALFKTYGIPSVSALLVATGQLASPETASKRTADTGVLLLEFALNKPSSERTIKAISRMNYLHARYQKSGKIKMLICYARLVYSLWSLPGGFTTATINQLAESHLEVLFLNVPTWLNEAGKHVVAVFLGERLRQAMMLPKPTPSYNLAIDSLLRVRKIILRYFMLPRPELMRKKYIASAPDNKTGRYNSVEYLSHPWYVKPTLRRRWGPRALITRVLGRRLPGDDNNKYASKGYLLEEIGPDVLKVKASRRLEQQRLH